MLRRENKGFSLDDPSFNGQNIDGCQGIFEQSIIYHPQPSPSHHFNEKKKMGTIWTNRALNSVIYRALNKQLRQPTDIEEIQCAIHNSQSFITLIFLYSLKCSSTKISFFFKKYTEPLALSIYSRERIYRKLWASILYIYLWVVALFESKNTIISIL